MNRHLMICEGIGVLNEGRTGVRRWCAQEWTDRPEPGGLIYRTWAVCPDCVPRFESHP